MRKSCHVITADLLLTIGTVGLIYYRKIIMWYLGFQQVSVTLISCSRVHMLKDGNHPKKLIINTKMHLAFSIKGIFPIKGKAQKELKMAK